MIMKEHILSLLPGDHPWQKQIHWFDSIESTNTTAKEMALSGAPHGTVLIADRQTGGKGRRGRSFLSPAGAGIYMSVILRPDCMPTDLMHLTCAAAVAMCDAVEAAAAFRPGIKWTNDLVMNGRKLGGILTELSLNPKTGKVIFAIIGIGINCHQAVRDFAPEIQEFAGSLDMFSRERTDRAKTAACMLLALDAMSRELLTGKETALTRYRRDCVTIGRDVCLVRSDECVHYGKALDVDTDGSLVVRFTDGRVEAVSSGEVSVRGMYGYL